MTKDKPKEKIKNSKPRKQLVVCIECLKDGKAPQDAIVQGGRRDHLKEVHGIVGDEEGKQLIPKASVRKHFIREGEPYEQPEETEE